MCLRADISVFVSFNIQALSSVNIDSKESETELQKPKVNLVEYEVAAVHVL